MTADAQTALRRTIEQHSRTTRFCLICNYVSRIIDPLTSRCAKFRFGAVAREDATQRMLAIAAKEGVVGAGREVVEAMVDCCDGDLRRAITMLQGAHRLGRPITVELVAELSGSIPPQVIHEIVQCLLSPKAAAQLFPYIKQHLFRSGYSITILLHQLLLKTLLHEATISPLQRGLIAAKAALVEARIQEGADENMQVTDFLLAVRSIIHPSESVNTRTNSMLVA